jgi:exopolyphosphatase/guanosine-5'-triphosphate,3'-diphosphate pyrophosphatase
MDAGHIEAVMDVGTNSVKLLVSELSPEKETELADRVEITRLGEGTDETGELSREAMERTARVIEDMAGQAFDLGAVRITAVGTQAMRNARNAGEFIRFVKSRCGVDIRVISGEKEAETAFLAALTAGYPGELLVLDVGGGSSELAFGSPSSSVYRRSVPVGALSLYKRFFSGVPLGGPVGRETLEGACRFVRDAAVKGGIFGGSCPTRCIGIGGTVVTMASVYLGLSESESGRADGSVLTAFEMERQMALYASMNSEERKRIRGMIPGRADIVLPGACVVKVLTELGGVKEITVTGRGLRHGLMAEIARSLFAAGSWDGM